MRRHFFGLCAIGFGGWEAVALTGRAPTITACCRSHRRLRTLWLIWLVALARHLWVA